jgi:WD40 repeat protein
MSNIGKQTFRAVAIIAIVGTLAMAQSQPSILQKIKDAAAQAAAKKAQQQPGQQPGQRPDKRGQSSQNQSSDSSPIKPPAGTKIEETVLAPVQEGARFLVSPHGLHVATVGNDGSRAVVYYDGVEGPKFDQILTQPSTDGVVFSPDSNRYAYCARAGNQYVVMVDGKELARSSESEGGIVAGTNCQLGFTSNNKHVYYFSKVTVTNPSTWGFTRFVFDGKPEPGNDSGWDTRELAFSPDGDHYAYVWSDPKRQKPWILIVDGKPAPYRGGAPQWTNDSKHLYTQLQVPQGGGTDLLFDGKPLMRAFNFRVYIPPVGNLVVVAVTGGNNFHPVSFLVVNGKKVPGSDTSERGIIDNVVFSPDGKHYAAICGDTSSHHYVITDGKRGQEYVSVTKLAFTPDSSTVVYESSLNGKNFIVVGEQEFGGSISGVEAPVIAAAGNRVAALMTLNGNPSILMDGKVRSLNGRGAQNLGFTPDGTHYAYFLLDTGMSLHLALDGAVQPASNMGGLGNASDAHFVFSPDSKHIAHLGLSPANDSRGLFLDGKYIALGQSIVTGHLTFTPDSKHLVWFLQMPGVNDFRVFIDGKAVAELGSAANRGVNDPIAATWFDMLPDGTLLILAQDDSSLKRITITPSDSTSLATLGGGGTMSAANH